MGNYLSFFFRRASEDTGESFGLPDYLRSDSDGGEGAEDRTDGILPIKGAIESPEEGPSTSESIFEALDEGSLEYVRVCKELVKELGMRYEEAESKAAYHDKQLYYYLLEKSSIGDSYERRRGDERDLERLN